MRVLIIGVGNIVRKAYLSAIRKLTMDLGIPLQVVGGYDINPEALAEFEKQAGDILAYPVKTFQDLDTALEEAELVIISTPTFSHYEIADRALDMGVNVYLEKPPTRYSWQLKALLDKARSKGLGLMIGHPRRFDPRFKVLKEIVQELGAPLFIRISERASLPQSDSWRWHYDLSGGVILDVGIHYVHLINWLLGRDLKLEVRARRVSEASRRWGAPDWAELILRSPETLVSVEVSWVGPKGASESAICLEAFFRGASVRLNDLESPGWYIPQSSENLHKIRYSALYSSPIEAFVEEIRYTFEGLEAGELSKLYVVAEESLRSMRLLEEALKSSIISS